MRSVESSGSDSDRDALRGLPDRSHRIDRPWYSSTVSTNTNAPQDVRPALAREIVWETHARRFWLAVVAGSLVPAALFAPLLQWAVSPELPGVEGLLTCFAGTAAVFAAFAVVVLTILLGSPGTEYFKRTNFCFALFEHGVELRDGEGKMLGETANGTLRVLSVNVQMGRQMVGAVRLVHRGGAFLLFPKQSVAPWPGMVASPFLAPYCSVANAAYERVLGFAV